MTDVWNEAPWVPRDWQRDALPVIVDALRRGERGIVSAVMGSGKSILQTALVATALPKTGDRVVLVTAPRQALVEQLAGTLRRWLGQETVGTFYARRKQHRRQVVVACNASVPRLRAELEKDGRRVALLVCDEAHGTQGATLRAEIPRLAPAALVGFTATPFRSIPRESLELFTAVLFRYTLEDAMQDGVLVPMRHERYHGDAGDDLDQACLEMIKDKAGPGPGIVSARNIADADRHAAWLTDQGLAAESIHSEHSSDERAAKLDRLRSGELRALVHVSLLAEGVDLPWLRWLCLRRNVQARVRFLQEIGRVFRVDPDPPEPLGPKVEGVVLDPLLLLGRHGLTSLEAIGVALREAAEEEARDGSTYREKKEANPGDVVALDTLIAFLYDLRAAMVDDGLIKLDRYDSGSQGWRLAHCSAKQVAAIKRAGRLTGSCAEHLRGPLRQLVKIPWALNKGEASDLLDVLYAGHRWSRATLADWQKYASQNPWSVSRAVEVPTADECKAAGRAGRTLQETA